MTTDFTGDDTWHETITGPADLEAMTGDSVSDMGVLLADRTIWLKNRVAGRYIVMAESQVTADVPGTTLLNAAALTTYTDVPTVTVNMSSCIDTDILVARLVIAAATEMESVASALRVRLACSAGSQVSQGAIVSSEAAAYQTIHVAHRFPIGLSATVTVKAQACVLTAATTANVLNSFALQVTHLRLVPTP